MKTPLVLGLLLFSFSNPSHATTFPLDRNDASAILAPDLRNAIEAPQPDYRNLPPTPHAENAVGYDVNTGKETSVSKGEYQEDPSSPANPGTNALSIQPESVIGADDRILISPTTSYPWRAQAKLYVKYPNGKTFICSGTLINPKYLISAGHCVFDKGQGGWATSIEIIPGLDNNYKPYGSVYASYMRTYQGWTIDENSNYDISLITLNSAIGNTVGWFGYTYYANPTGVSANIVGYPGDRDNGLRMYFHYGPVLSTDTYFINYTIDTAPGQSGSGVYYITNGNRYVIAAHSYGRGTYNSGTRLTSQRVNDFMAWIASGT